MTTKNVMGVLGLLCDVDTEKNSSNSKIHLKTEKSSPFYHVRTWSVTSKVGKFPRISENFRKPEKNEKSQK